MTNQERAEDLVTTVLLHFAEHGVHTIRADVDSEEQLRREYQIFKNTYAPMCQDITWKDITNAVFMLQQNNVGELTWQDGCNSWQTLLTEEQRMARNTQLQAKYGEQYITMRKLADDFFDFYSLGMD